MLARTAANAVLRAMSIQNPERRPRCIITSFVPRSRDCGASRAAYDRSNLPGMMGSINMEASLFQRLDGQQMIYLGKLRHYAVTTSISRISQRVSGSP